MMGRNRSPRTVRGCARDPKLSSPAALLLLLLLAAGGVQAQTAPGESPHIRNTAAAPALERVALKELWRIGGADDEAFFGVVGQALADEAGRIYLLDIQLNQVQVYSPEGALLRALSREGEGPGEIRGAADMCFLPGGRLALLQSFPGRAVIIDLEDHPAGGFSMGGSDPSQGSFGVLVAGKSAGAHLVVGGMRMTFSPQGLSDQAFFLSSVDEQGTERVRYLEKNYPINYADFVASEEGFDFVWSGRWDLAPDGRVFAAPKRDAYEIEVRRADGTLERVIEREHSTRPRSDAEKREARLLVEAVARNYPTPPREVTVLATEPAITAIHCRPDGELWVRTGRGDSERGPGVLTTFDVFDGEGRLRRQVALLAPGDPRLDAIYLLGSDRVLVVTQALESYRTMQGVASEEASQAEPMEVICYGMAAR